MLKFLIKPSPIFFSTKVRLILSFAIAIFVFGFLLIFQPFGVFDYLTVPAYQACLGFGLIALILNFFFLLGWNEWLLRKYDQRWTMWKQLLSIFIHVSLIGLVNGFYSQYIFSPEYSEGFSIGETILRELFFAHSIAFIPIAFLITIIELRLSQHYSEQSESFASISKSQGEVCVAIITLDNGENEISLSSDTFRFAKSSGNYVEFFYSEKGEISKNLQRITLSKLEEQIAKSPLNVMKTHRSYIVNLDAIENVKGNAQGYLLNLVDTDDCVPVARNKVADFNVVMNG